jgi:hypothetical protein
MPEAGTEEMCDARFGIPLRYWFGAKLADRGICFSPELRTAGDCRKLRQAGNVFCWLPRRFS